MSYIIETMGNLIQQTAFFNITWGNYVMIAVACVFLYLAIAKEYEPLLLVPISFGMLLVNIYPPIRKKADYYITSSCLMNGRFCHPSSSWV